MEPNAISSNGSTNSNRFSEVDLGLVFAILWAHKLFLAFCVLVAIPMSMLFINFTAPTYVAEAVIEKIEKKSQRGEMGLIASVVGDGVLNSLMRQGPSRDGQNNHVAQIYSKEFLKQVVSRNSILDDYLYEYCAFRPKPLYSLRGILGLIGIIDVYYPDEEQKQDKVLNCVADMIFVSKFSYGEIFTSAVRIQTKTKDADFSANLANSVVEQFFLWEKARNDRAFERTRKYLADTISKAQLDLNKSQQKLREFSLENASLVGESSSFSLQAADENVATVKESPFAKNIAKKIYDLGRTERLEEDYGNALHRLKKLVDGDIDELRSIMNLTTNSEVFSRKFITEISKINSADSKAIEFRLAAKRLILLEIDRLKRQLSIFEENKAVREEQTNSLMKIEKEYRILELDVQKKAFIFESLKDQLNVKIIEAGLNELTEHSWLTKAVPPLGPSVSKKTILILFAMALFFVGSIIVFFRQRFSEAILKLNQIQNITSFTNLFELPLKFLNRSGERSELPVNHKFVSQLLSRGKLGCIIDMSSGNKKDSGLALKASILFSSFVVRNNESVLCVSSKKMGVSLNSTLDRVKSFLPFFSSKHNLKDMDVIKVLEDEGEIEAGKFFPLKDDFKKFDRIMVSIGSSGNQITKFEMIEKCDYYILVGLAGSLKKSSCKVFLENFDDKDSKCLGCFLLK